jgi:hypothetical protein
MISFRTGFPSLRLPATYEIFNEDGVKVELSP